MAWQIAFLIIGSSPARFRLLMIPSILEKFGHVVTVAALVRPGAHLGSGRRGGRARPAAGDSFRRRVCEDHDSEVERQSLYFIVDLLLLRACSPHIRRITTPWGAGVRPVF